MFYDNFLSACHSRGTNLTSVLKALGKSTGNTGSWKSTTYPKLDIVMEMANYLGMSLDELVYGSESKAVILTDSDKEWLDLIARIPEDKKAMCKAFLETHVAVQETPAKYADKKRA